MSKVDHRRLVNLIDQIKQYYYNTFLYVDIVQVHASVMHGYIIHVYMYKRNQSVLSPL